MSVRAWTVPEAAIPAGASPRDRRALAATLVPDADTLESGNDFDVLPPERDLVSVVVPSYAHEKFVEEALCSIVEQSYRRIEIILIDDSSPDRTFDLALALLRHCPLPYCALRRRHAGMEANLNAGIQLAHGRWIAMLASDDLFPKNSLESLVKAARATGAEAVVGPVDDVTLHGEFKASRASSIARYSGLSGELLRNALLEEHGSLMIQGMLISRDVFARVGWFDTRLFASDFDFLLRMASAEVRFAFVPETTALHRQTRTHLSRDHLQSGLRSHLAIARLHARSPGEFRRAASRFEVETAFTSYRYGHLADAIAGMLRAGLLAPLVTARIAGARVLNRLRRRPR
jgi:GT2 family glycosyltransferase